MNRVLGALLLIWVTASDTVVLASDELMAPGPLPDIVLGNADAKNVIIEYASMTPRCAEFQKGVFPALKAKYIDTGNAKYILREFPLESLEVAAFMIARCAPEDRYYTVVDALFAKQESLFAPGETRDLLLQIATGTSGLSAEKFDQCIADRELFSKIAQGRQRAHERFGVDSTPTFFVNGKRLAGDQLKDFDGALGQAGETVVANETKPITEASPPEPSTTALSPELPKCGDSEVLDTLSGLEIRAAQATINFQTTMQAVQQAAIIGVIQGKDTAALEKRLGLEVGPRGPAGLPDLDSINRLSEKIREELGKATFTYSGVRVNATDGNTKFCAADMAMKVVNLWGDLTTTSLGSVTYTVQLTEDGKPYVTGTGGADFHSQGDNAVANELARQREQEEKDRLEYQYQQRSRQFEEDYRRDQEIERQRQEQYQHELQEQTNRLRQKMDDF